MRRQLFIDRITHVNIEQYDDTMAAFALTYALRQLPLSLVMNKFSAKARRASKRKLAILKYKTDCLTSSPPLV